MEAAEIYAAADDEDVMPCVSDLQLVPEVEAEEVPVEDVAELGYN